MPGQSAAASRPGWPQEGTARPRASPRGHGTAAASVTVLPQALPGEGRGRRGRVSGAWPLLVVLAVQAALSLRLLRADTASQVRPCTCTPGIWNGRTGCTVVPVPPFPYVLLWRASDLPADRRGGGQHRRAGRSPGPVPGVHARRHHLAVGCCRPAVRAAGRVLRRRAVRRARHRPCTWGRSPPTTRCRCSWSRWRPGA